jgi:hypothetical protein
MSTPFSEQDRQFLKAVGINAEPTLDETRQALAQPDGTVRLLEKFGIPVTRENYLRLAFAGNPPQGPLDGEIEVELPPELQMVDINNAPSAGNCGEPSHTTLQGFPLCARCGRSTRNMNALVCAQCRNHTRLVLTKADRR